MIISCISLGFGLLVKWNKTFEDVILGCGEFLWEAFSQFLHRLDDKSIMTIIVTVSDFIIKQSHSLGIKCHNLRSTFLHCLLSVWLIHSCQTARDSVLPVWKWKQNVFTPVQKDRGQKCLCRWRWSPVVSVRQDWTFKDHSVDCEPKE